MVGITYSYKRTAVGGISNVDTGIFGITGYTVFTVGIR